MGCDVFTFLYDIYSGVDGRLQMNCDIREKEGMK